jgi:hypothetical protein
LKHKKLPVKIANAIEALAFKMMWIKDQQKGIVGTRAFERYPGAMSFNELSDEKYYVQVTRRQATVRALLGLGLTEGGLRMNSMTLSAIGRDLANCFLNRPRGGGNRKVRNAIINWIEEPDKPFKKISPDIMGIKSATSAEKAIVRSCLRSSVISSAEDYDIDRRNRLIEAMEKGDDPSMPDLETIKENLMKHSKGKNQVKDIETAEAFDDMLGAARQIVQKCASFLENSDNVSAKNLSNKLDEDLNALKTNAQGFIENAEFSRKRHTDASKFASKIISTENVNVLKEIVMRDGKILCYSGESVHKGHLFERRIEIGTETTPSLHEDEYNDGSEESSTTDKVNQLFTLWRDCEKTK